MALFFHSDEVDEFIPFKEAVAISENALRDLKTQAGVNAPRKRLNLHRDIAEGSFDTVLNIYAGGSAAYSAIGAQVALHRKAIVGSMRVKRTGCRFAARRYLLARAEWSDRVG